MISNETRHARATMWELLAFSFRYPDAGLAEVVASGEWADAAAEVAEALELDMPEGWLGGLAAATDAAGAGADASADALLHALRAEGTRLFVGAPEPVVSPYEGVWAARDDGVQPLLFVNPRSMAVERFCRACGLGRPEGTNEPLDHVATECELLEYLAALAAGIATPPEGRPADGGPAVATSPAPEGEPAAALPEDAPTAPALPGGSPAAAYATFLDEHARAWMPRFAEATAAEARHPFYRAAAQLLGAVAK